MDRKSLLYCLALAALIPFIIMFGCTSAAQVEQEYSMEYQASVPTCKSQKECEAKWAAARQWVIDNASYKIQHFTDDYIETFNPMRNNSNIAVRVIKEQISQNHYRIVIKAWCGKKSGCKDKVRQVMLDFNRYVNAVQVK